MAGIIKSAMREDPDEEALENEAPADDNPTEEAAEAQSDDAAPAEPEADDSSAPGKKPEYKTRVIDAIPANLREPFERVVLAGQSVLYAKQMVPEIQKMLARDVPTWQKLAEGIAVLMKLLDLQSKRTMPQELLIPCGIELVAEFGAFLQETGAVEVTDEDIQQATVYIAVAIPKLYGAKDEDIHGMFQQAATGGQPAAAPAQGE